MNIFSEIGSFFYLVVGLSIFMISFTMFVNFVRGFAILGASIAIGYYIFIAAPSTKINLDKYADKVFNLSGDYTSDIKSFTNSIESKVKDKIGKLK